jgi:Myb-like DNA-binding protein FlbD
VKISRFSTEAASYFCVRTFPRLFHVSIVRAAFHFKTLANAAGKSCLFRLTLSSMTRPNRRGPWLPDEDETLLQLVHTQGPNNWVRISQHMQHRSPKQCRERYHQNLKPSLNHEPISSQEGEMIEQMVNDMGKRWAEIARRLRNRSDNAVKNWWNGSMNRRKRNVIQHGHGMKGVGNRLQPIPVAKPLKTMMDRTDRGRHCPSADHQYEPNRTEPALQESQRSRHVVLPAFPQSILVGSTNQITGRQTSPPDAYPSNPASSGYATYNSSPNYNRFLPSLHQFHQSGPISSPPHTQPCQRATEHAPRLQQYSPDDRFGPASFQFSSQRSCEPALISPVPTDVSHAPSLDRAPSLVSDNQSNCSISPKTVPSPRPDMPAPIETDIQAWARQLSDRRDSASNILPNSKSQSKVFPDEGYVSALPHSAVLDNKAFLSLQGQDFYRRGSVDAYVSSKHPPPYTPSAPLPAPMDPPNTCRAGQGLKDARMHLSNLLG